MPTRGVQTIKWLLTIFGGAAALLFFWQSVRNHNYPNGNDLTSYLNSARSFFDGVNPYCAEVRRFIYPLFLPLVCYPLSFLQNGFWQKALTAGFWSSLAWFALFRTIFTSWNNLYDPRAAIAWLKQNAATLGLIVFLLHPFLQDEFLNGQVNLIIVGLVTGFFFALEKDRRFLAALFLSAAAAIKIGPGLCLLFVFITNQPRTIVYFAGLMFLWVLGIPYLVNDQALVYYGYFVDTVLPQVAASDFEHGWRQYSILSSVSYAFDLHWQPLLKMITSCLIALGLAAPILVFGRRLPAAGEVRGRLTAFAALLPIIPLAFPMSEAHHLLILTLSLVVTLDYWKERLSGVGDMFEDRLSLTFLTAWLLLHLGHAVKPAPFRLLGLLVLYTAMVALLRRRQGSSLEK